MSDTFAEQLERVRHYIDYKHYGWDKAVCRESDIAAVLARYDKMQKALEKIDHDGGHSTYSQLVVTAREALQ